MKKILKNWNNFINEGIDKDQLLDKVRELFFGAYNTFDDEFAELHDAKVQSLFKQLEATAEQKFTDPEKIAKVVGNANIGISLYWTDDLNHGAGSPEAAAYIIEKKLNILEARLTTEEKDLLKNGLMNSIIDSIRQDRSNQMYPTSLAVSVGVINGIQVNDAYMTTSEGVNRYVIPILSSYGYYSGSPSPVNNQPRKTKRKKYEPEMSMADMKAMMDKFSR